MASASVKQQNMDACNLLGLDAGIAALEAGNADASLCIDFGGGLIGKADGPHQLAGLLQRARGLRLISLMVEKNAVERPADMRSGKPALHPSVKEILDALKSSG